MIVLGTLSLLAALLCGALYAKAFRSLRMLSDIEPLPLSNALPRITLIAAARNEERNIEQAARTLLKQDYPNLEIILVNDRSTDRTGAILEKIAREEPRLRLKNIRELPAGWLGKNHALHEAAKEATGEWILFTDADIHLYTDALRCALNYAQKQGLDHLGVLPDSRMPGPILPAFLVHFGVTFLTFVRVWEVRDSKKSAHVGIGAFNLVKTSVFRKVGGFEKIPLRPDDDLKLGKVLKLQGGARQDLLDGRDRVVVEWYSSVGELVRGLEKNSFAGMDYNVGIWLFGSFMQFLVFVWPWIGLWVGPLWARIPCVAAALIVTTMYAFQAQQMKTPRKSACFFPLMGTLFLWILGRATILTFVRGGIYWRGTFYPLRALKNNRV